jgi:hypothetical protein
MALRNLVNNHIYACVIRCNSESPIYDILYLFVFCELIMINCICSIKLMMQSSDSIPQSRHMTFVVKGCCGSSSLQVLLNASAERVVKFIHKHRHEQKTFLVQRYFQQLKESEFRFYCHRKSHPLHRPSYSAITAVSHVQRPSVITFRGNDHRYINSILNDDQRLAFHLASDFCNAIINRLKEIEFLTASTTPILRIDCYLFNKKLYLNEIEFDWDMSFFSNFHDNDIATNYAPLAFIDMINVFKQANL